MLFFMYVHRLMENAKQLRTIIIDKKKKKKLLSKLPKE